MFYNETLFAAVNCQFWQNKVRYRDVFRRIKFLIFPLITLFGLSGYTYFNLFYTGPSETQLVEVPQDRPSPKTLQQRQIANTNEQQVSVECMETQLNAVLTIQKNLMIKLVNCPASLDPAQIQILNQSNQYQAQVFKSQSGEYLTDFIQLAPGVNNLKLEFSLNDGQTKTQMIKIEQKTFEIQ